MKIKIDQKLIDEKYISKRKHPSCDYYIYNYTAKTDYDTYWNEQTLMCRGLILDVDNNIIARPFKKFFNISQYGEESHLGVFKYYDDFEVFDKADGSLGILYTMPDGEFRIATRGSFESNQAIEATKILKEKYSHVPFSKEHTYLFEIIYPENRIVLDYKDTRDLILLAVIDNYSGREMYRSHDIKFAYANNLNLVKSYTFRNIEELMNSEQEQNREGYVIRYGGGLRVKFKFEEYKRLHRIVTNMSEKAIWQLLRDGNSFETILTNVPDEFFDWVTDVKNKLEKEFDSVERLCYTAVDKVKYDSKIETRKQVAEYYKQFPKHIGILFAMHDKKDYKKLIYNLIKPVSKI